MKNLRREKAIGLSIALSAVLGFAAFSPVTGCVVDQGPKAETPKVSVALPPAKVAVVGTIHKMHLANRDYPMQVLAALVDEWNPDLVLVALPPKAIQDEAWEQGPIEMSYAIWLARHAHIPVEGIGWHDPRQCRAKAVTMQKKMREMMAKMKEMKASGKTMDMATMRAMRAKKMAAMLPPDASGLPKAFMELMPPGFETAHSLLFTRLQRALFNAMARSKPGMLARALAKEAHMAHLAAAAIRRHHAGRVLVVVGLRHRLALVDHLAGLGAKMVNPTTILAPRGLRARAFLNRPISQQVLAMWRKAVKDIDDRLAQASGPMRMMLAMKKHCFELAISQNGRCCLPMNKLMPNMKKIMAQAAGPQSSPTPASASGKPTGPATAPAPAPAPAPATAGQGAQGGQSASNASGSPAPADNQTEGQSSHGAGAQPKTPPSSDTAPASTPHPASENRDQPTARPAAR